MSGEIQYVLSPGKKLGRHYRIVSTLGNGWEGEVYKVEETATGIIRAAKLFYKHRYEHKKLPHIDYAKKLNQLRSCPIVIQYHHQDQLRIKGCNIDFLVSDFIDGDVLSEYIDKQPQKRLLPFEALNLFYELIKGVEKIHLLNEYHGDIHSDNIMVKRKGLHFEVHLIDFMHLGKSSKNKIQIDIYDLISVLYEMIGGKKYYRKAPSQIKEIILGRKHNLINKQFQNAEQLRLFLEKLEW